MTDAGQSRPISGPRAHKPAIFRWMAYAAAKQGHRSRRVLGHAALGVAAIIVGIAGCGGEGDEPLPQAPAPSASTGGKDASAPDATTPSTEDPTADAGSPDAGTDPEPLSEPVVAYTGSSAVVGLLAAKGPFDMGHEFEVTQEGIIIVDLGIWDAKADGLVSAHTVALFSLDRPGAGANATPIPGGSVVVPAGTSALLQDGHRFAPLPAPLALAPGHYAVVAFGLDKDDPYGDGGNIPLSSTGVTDANFDPQNPSKPGVTFPTGGDTKPHACASFRYRGANTSFVKIMPLGASITEGWSSTAPVAGYRGYLHTLLNEAGVAHQFVGSSTTRPGSLPPDQRHHEGHPGWVIKALKAGQNGVMDHFDEWLGKTGVTPDYILVLVGTNDVNGDNDFPRVGDRIDALITSISNPTTGYAPKARLILSTLPSIGKKSDPNNQKNKNVITFNKKLVELAKKHADEGENVSTIDAYAVVGDGDKADALHPNDGGYAKIAPLWRDAILSP